MRTWTGQSPVGIEPLPFTGNRVRWGRALDFYLDSRVLHVHFAAPADSTDDNKRSISSNSVQVENRVSMARRHRPQPLHNNPASRIGTPKSDTTHHPSLCILTALASIDPSAACECISISAMSGLTLRESTAVCDAPTHRGLTALRLITLDGPHIPSSTYESE